MDVRTVMDAKKTSVKKEAIIMCGGAPGCGFFAGFPPDSTNPKPDMLGGEVEEKEALTSEDDPACGE